MAPPACRGILKSSFYPIRLRLASLQYYIIYQKKKIKPGIMMRLGTFLAAPDGEKHGSIQPLFANPGTAACNKRPRCSSW